MWVQGLSGGVVKHAKRAWPYHRRDACRKNNKINRRVRMIAEGSWSSSSVLLFFSSTSLSTLGQRVQVKTFSPVNLYLASLLYSEIWETTRDCKQEYYSGFLLPQMLVDIGIMLNHVNLCVHFFTFFTFIFHSPQWTYSSSSYSRTETLLGAPNNTKRGPSRPSGLRMTLSPLSTCWAIVIASTRTYDAMWEDKNKWAMNAKNWRTWAHIP